MGYGVADFGTAVSVGEIRAIRRDGRPVPDALKEPGDFMRERIAPADRVARLWPPRRHIGMVGARCLNRRLCVAGPDMSQFVESGGGEYERAARSFEPESAVA